MGQALLIICTTCLLSLSSAAQDKIDEHLLDGTSMDYYYQNGSGVHVEFANGQFNWKWIAGPDKGAIGNEKYLSRKIGDKTYMINFKVTTSSNFVTIIFNFNQNVMYTSALLDPKTPQEQVLFEGGIIEHLRLKEN
ncbi:MAG TPA: MoaF N-terminal domain-containing protein [Chitinophagaceae bacterium]|nr:MoaF N-terminal domain-containing protein [Chitinophagaceae bacterium]